MNQKMEDFNDGVDGKLASRMRKVNPEQFSTLVKMHLSFELDINTDDNDLILEKAKLKKWGLLNFSRKPKSMMNLQQKSPEGGILTFEAISQVKQLIEYLSNEQCISQEGIFRRTGKLTRQQELKSSLYQGLPLKLDDGKYSVHDCASVLKGFLAELPEPLLTELHYPAHYQIAELCYSNSEANESRLTRSIQLLLLLLPSVNRILLKHLLTLLNKTAAFESSNKMNCDTLATLFTPHLMCPRKLSPEALHINSQILSGLVALMIKKSEELFEIPQKLAIDIRAYWVDQERRLLSPNKKDLNESISDTTGTAHTVFSFVDHKLTTKANTTDDTQAALAQLYAHIQAMPESAKKRRLVKQFNKENGQGTPRHVKQVRTKSLGDSIKKHIFQKKLLSAKKIIDINIGCNIRRSSSEENILSGSFEKSIIPSKVLFSKSDEELSAESFGIDHENLASIAVSHDAENTPDIIVEKVEKNKVVLKDIVNICDDEITNHCQSTDDPYTSGDVNNTTKNSNKSILINKDNTSKTPDKFGLTSCTVRRYNSEPISVYTSPNKTNKPNDFVAQDSTYPVSFSPKKSNFEVVFTPIKSVGEFKSNYSLRKDITCANTSPMIKQKFWNVHGAHTSTPSNLLRHNLANEYGLTPIATNDKSMSPITQSTSKMTKAMQETMMTPRSRKPVMMISATNLCNLATLDENNVQTPSNNRLQLVNIDIDCESNSVSEKSSKIEKVNTAKTISCDDNLWTDKENIRRPPFPFASTNKNFVTSIDDDFATSIQPSSTSITSTFREYLLSRSVLTASPVDLSFTSRTGDFEQSESDLNILNEDGLSDSLMHCLDGNNPSSDTSGIASGSTDSANNSTEKIDSTGPSPRKRGTNLHRNDSKRSVKSINELKDVNEQIDYKTNEANHDESSLNENLKDTFQETSF